MRPLRFFPVMGLLSLMIGLAGCQTTVPPEATWTPAPVEATAVPTPAPTKRVPPPTATLHPPTPQPTVSKASRLVWGKITSPALKENLLGDSETRPYAVYLPPGYATSDQRYPVIYVLHGYSQYPNALTNMVPTIDTLIATGTIGPMLAVFVDGSNQMGGSWYQSSTTIGNYETYLTRELVNTIDANYRTVADRRQRGITGFSMGGYGAMRLALKYPNIFSAVVAQGGIYDIESDLRWMAADPAVTYAASVAKADPKDWHEFNGIDRNARGVLAMAAAMAPDPAQPPFYLDNPYRLVNGQAEIVPEVVQRMAASDPLHELPRYAEQPQRLNGILLVHGKLDIPQRAQILADAMTKLGIDHELFLHDGGHLFLPEKSLQFLWQHLGAASAVP